MIFSKHYWHIRLRFLSDLFHSSRILINPLQSYGYLRSGRKPDIGYFRMASLNFCGRKEDWLAIREVLIDDEYGCIRYLINSNGCPRVIDLGSNIGCFALCTFQHNPHARVVSVEAAEDTFGILKRNKELNSKLDWQLFNLGVWSDDSQLNLMRRGVSVGHRVVQDGEGDVVQGISLQALTEALGWGGSIDLIKMDIEGGEEAVIPASEEVLRRTRYLIIEIHNDRIDAQPVMEVLNRVFKYHLQLNHRTSSKPLFIMSNDRIDLP